MSKSKRIITYAVTIAVIAAIAVAAITFLRRSMRDTVYLQDYALTLGSDDLFVNENSNIYRLAHSMEYTIEFSLKNSVIHRFKLSDFESTIEDLTVN